MKKQTQIAVIFLLLFSFVNCDSNYDGCNGTMIYGECVPDYTYPSNWVFEEGKAYDHKKYGVIVYCNDNWINADATIITNNELLIE